MFKRDSKYWLFPFWILLSSFLYFSIYQYSKAKQLRIENQNKVALLHWLQALRSDTTEWMEKWRFYDNIANVVFTKVYNSKEKEQNLPIDKLIEVVNIIKKN